VVNMIYPPTHITKPSSHDIPNPSTFYPNYPNYTYGESYNATALPKQNNPQFVNYPLPVAGVMSLYNYVGSYNFHLTSSSPAIGKGFTGFAPLNATSAVTDPFLRATVTPPNSDLGAFPTDNSGNQH
ncbi:MAG: hypothetical protein H7282_03640, partial [Cytophagaceae bacterium]|nr:hypothetical protein [Cytophagaceae bacterium]